MMKGLGDLQQERGYSFFLKPFITLMVCTLPNRTTMKLALIFLTAILFCTTARSANYYFANAGNDANAGTSAASPFQTITRLNLLISSKTLHAGDTVFFKCDDTFRGQILMKLPGTAALPIVFTSYSTGEKPVISGAELITGWTLNGSMYQAAFSQLVNNFFVGDKEQMLARYPNNGRYLILDSAQVDYLKDVDITGIAAGMVNNSKICIHTAQWCWEKTGVASVAADKVTYTSPVSIAAIAKFGYFLYDNILHLDTAMEWKYDNSTQVINYMSSGGVNPNTLKCEGSVYNNGITIDSTASYITIRGLSFEKQSNAGIAILNATNRYIKVDNCYFARQYNHGVNDRGKYNEVSYSYFREVDGIAVYLSGNGSNETIHHNTFRNIGQFRNSGIGTQINLSAIKAAFVDSSYIHHNDIDSTGYCGIATDGGWHIVEKNIINHAMLINNDGAALKTFGLGSHDLIFRNNFISNSDGNTEGTDNGNFITPAIYFDFQSNTSLVEENTIYDRAHKGIFQNSGTFSNTIRNNVIYGFDFGIDMNGNIQTNTPIHDMTVTGNKLFALSSNGIAIRQVDYTGAYDQISINNNYYFQPYSSNYALRFPGPLLSFAGWQALGYDANSKINSFTWASGTDSSKLFINPTDNAVVQDLLGYQWKDLDGNIVTSLTLQPWTSKILIRYSTTVFPLNLLSFTATKADKDVRCVWQTSAEVNVSHFNVQRSFNGTDYTSIGKVNATNTNNTTAYRFVDVNAAELKAPYLYYRLEIADKDLKHQFSAAERITWNAEADVKIYPNPATEFIRVNSKNIKAIHLYDANGKLVLQKNNCTDNDMLSVSGLAKGSYWIKVYHGDMVTVQLVMVQ
jgi:hypothetical protein